MKYAVHLFHTFATTSLFFSIVANHEIKLTAVSYFETLSNFYHRIRNDAHPDDSLVVDTKHICKEIIGSNFFKQEELMYVDPDGVFNKLRPNKHNEIFKDMYKKKSISFKNIVSPRDRYVYRNTYFTKDIRVIPSTAETFNPTEDRPPTPSRADNGRDVSTIGGAGGYREKNTVMKEHLFACLTRKSNSDDFRKWYITKLYDMNEVRRGARSVVGRFVFERMKDKFELAALAEEPAQSLKISKPLELFYIEDLRKDRKPASKNVMDPICKLANQYERHSRLCTVILNSSLLGEEVRETDFTKVLDDECRWLEITFKTPEANQKARKRYFEWMVKCKAISTVTHNEQHYYVSRAYRPDTVLVYDSDYDSKGKLFLIDASTNINIAA